MTREQAENMIGQTVWLWEASWVWSSPRYDLLLESHMAHFDSWKDKVFATEVEAWEAKALWHEEQAQQARKRAEEVRKCPSSMPMSRCWTPAPCWKEKNEDE